MTVRELIALPIACVSILLLLLALTSPLMLSEQSNKDAKRLNELRVVAEHINQIIAIEHVYPNDDQLR